MRETTHWSDWFLRKIVFGGCIVLDNLKNNNDLNLSTNGKKLLFKTNCSLGNNFLFKKKLFLNQKNNVACSGVPINIEKSSGTIYEPFYFRLWMDYLNYIFQGKILQKINLKSEAQTLRYTKNELKSLFYSSPFRPWCEFPVQFCRSSCSFRYDGDNLFDQHEQQWMILDLDAMLRYKQPSSNPYASSWGVSLYANGKWHL